ADRVSVFFLDDNVVELADGGHPAASAKRERLRTLIDASAGHFDVLCLQSARHIGYREVIGAQPIGVEPHIDLSLATAEHENLTDPGNAFELASQHLVRVLSDFTNGFVRGQRDAEHG